MIETADFFPPRRRGLLFHAAMLLVLGGASTLAFLFGLSQQAGALFAPLLILALVLFAPIPWVVYRAFALTRAVYRLERDGLRLRWGMRAEDIPLPEIEWVRRPNELVAHLPHPPLQWPGALLGVAHSPDLGAVEYIASEKNGMLLIATQRRIYAISPDDPEAFLRAFQRALEMGSLTPIASATVLPAAYLAQIWADKVTRTLLALGFVLNLLLLVGASLLVSGPARAALGIHVGEAAPAGQVLLLPILGAFVFVADLAIGLFFYRRPQQRHIAYMIWGSAPLSAALMIIGMLRMAGLLWR